ncbi:MAG: phenylalanine--tRNA ligase subunit beta [Tepidisphaeraceae bacterium]|jgi:phenylalanyl-tRNA synthetase beta chain
MKISLKWLGDFVSGPLDAQQAADALTNGGLPVEGIASHHGDAALDVEVTSNRSDCLSHVGVARELAALLDRPFVDVQPKAAQDAAEVGEAVEVRIEAGELCPLYTARVIRGVKIGPAPAWMTQRLEAVDVRPVNNVVDVTNYVMLEMGQPLHAFDLAKIGGGQIVVRTARPGESLVSIDGKKRELSPQMLVIADAQRAVAVAGVMGGIESEVSGATQDVLLESARFDPLSVRRTARALVMASDSSYRFERGIDPALAARASLRAAELILATAGGRLLKGMAAAGASGPGTRRLSLRLARLRQILGVELPTDQVMGAFSRLGLGPVLLADGIDVSVPSHRLDLLQEIDLVEEAARVLGYGRIATRPDISIQLTPPDRRTATVQSICQTLVACGYFEAVTFSFVSDVLKEDFGRSMWRADRMVRKADASLRPSLIPGLLEAVKWNEANGTPGAKLFEIGATFAPGTNGKVDERVKAAWVGSADLREVRGAAEAVLRALDGRRGVKVVPDHREGFAAGACGRVIWGEEPIGFLGRIERSVAQKLSLREAPTAAELELQPLLAGYQHVPRLAELPKFPAVRRDLSLIVSQSVRYQQIEDLIRGLGLADLEDLEYVTTYRGKPLEAGTKSVTVTLIFRRATATLTGEQVESSVQKAIAAAKDKLGATLRT